MTIHEFVNRLNSLGCQPVKSGQGYLCKCPSHEDNSPSLSVNEGDEGKILVNCFAGCFTQDICGAVGIELKDLMPERNDILPYRSSRKSSSKPSTNTKPKQAPITPISDDSATIKQVAGMFSKLGKPSAHYPYRDHQGRLVGIVFRWDSDTGKEIRQAALVNGQWQTKAMPQPRPLYNLPAITDAETVYVCEGEKCVDSLTQLGLTATCSSGGSKAANKADWTPLAGKDVIVLPDRDEAGEQYCNDVVNAISGIARSIRIVRLEHPEGGASKGYDVADWIADCRQLLPDSSNPELIAKLQSLCEQAESLEARPQEDESPEDSRPQWVPFPIELLPGIVGEYVKAVSSSMCCDPAFAALPLLAGLASAIGNSRRIRLKKSWSEPCVFWMVAMGESGVLKSPPMDHVLTFIRDKQRAEYKEFADRQKEYRQQMLSYESELKQWQRQSAKDVTIGPAPEPPAAPVWQQRVVDDCTIEAIAELLSEQPRGLLVAVDELSGWVAKFDAYKSSRGGDAAQWLSMHRAGQLLINRKTGKRVVYVPRASVSLCGTIQPPILKLILSGGRKEEESTEGKSDAEHVANGLLARMLLARPPRKAKVWTDDDVDDVLRVRMENLFAELFALEMPLDDQGEPQPVSLCMSPTAKLVWVSFYNQHAIETVSQSSDLAAAWSKLEGYAARFALLMQLLHDPYATEIGPEAMEAGIGLSRWFGNEAERVYSELGADSATEGSQLERDEDRLLAWLKSRGGSASLRDVQRSLSLTKEKAECVLGPLVQKGLLAWQTQANPKGPPTQMVMVA